MAINNKKTFIWDSNSFSEKGYWYLAGVNGKKGRLASKSEVKQLGKPINGKNTKEIESSSKPQKVVINESIINSMSTRIGGLSSSIRNDKGLKPPKLVKNVDTTSYTSLGENQTNRLRRGDGIADVAAKLFNLFIGINNDEKLHQELDHNFEKEVSENEAKRFSLLHSNETDEAKKLKEDKSESPIMKLLRALRLGFEKIGLLKSFKKLLHVGEVLGGIVWKIIKFIVPKTPIGKVLSLVAAAAGVYELNEHGYFEPLKALIGKGEGKYTSANMGTKGGKIIPHEDIDFSKMTVGELMRRQSIKWGDKNESEKILGAGKYQVTPEPLKEAVQKGVLKETDFFTPTNQEILAENFLLTSKRPEIMQYITSETADPKLKHDAQVGLAKEFASLGDPDSSDGKTSMYGEGNKATISSEQVGNALDTVRELYKKTKATLTPKEKEITPLPNTIGSDLNTSSIEQADIKKEMQQQLIQPPSVVIDNSTNTNISTFQQNMDSFFDDSLLYPSILNYN